MSNTLKILLDGAMGRKVPADFAVENYDYESALRDELKKLVGTPNLFRRNRYDVYDLLTENLDEILPQKVNSAVGLFSEVMQVPQGTRCEFRVKRGKMRAKQFVTRATASGVYETFRLDRDRVEVPCVAYGGAGIIDFERYLDGVENIMDVYDIITEGLVDVVFDLIQEALLMSWKDAGRPTANKVTATEFDAAEMLRLCNTVAAYGAPVIYCSPEFASEMANVLVYDTEIKLSNQDMMDIREQGYIGKFRGTPVVVLPQSYKDETNTKLTMNPCFAYVIPSGKEKIVKVAMEGQSYFKDVENADNSMEVQAYKKLGVAIVNTPNYWGIYYNSGISAGGWDEFNTSLTT